MRGLSEKRYFMQIWHRRCIGFGTPITMFDGTYKPIEQIKKGDKILSWNGKDLVSDVVVDSWYAGEKETIRLNHRLVCTPDHRFLQKNNLYKKIEECRYVFAARKGIFGKISNPELAELLGLMVTDGSITWNQTPKFTNINKQILDRVKFLVNKLFPEIDIKTYRKGNGFDLVFTYKNKPRKHIFRDYFKDSNAIPDIVWKFDRESLLAFFGGVVAGDGSISIKVSDTPRSFKSLSVQIVIEGGINEKLAEDYQLLLDKFGCKSKIKKDPRGRNWRVFIYSSRSIHRLKGMKINCDYKQKKFDFVLNNSRADLDIPLRQETVKIREEVGLYPTYDLETEKYHNFIADSFVVHNSGKDKCNIADIVPRRLLLSPTLVKYVYPTLVMGRDNLWDGMGSDGFRYLNHIPDEIRSGVANKTRMTVDIKGGSIFQIAGSDNPDSLRGGNAKLNIFSEWSEHDPYAWDVVEPILRENGGISIFNMTPKGDNHARAMYEFAKNHPLWYVEILTAKDTGVFDDRQLDDILKDTINRFIAQGRSEEEAQAYFDQEYLCSFKSPVIGSYYGAAIRKAEDDKRITRVPYDPRFPVQTFWDIGVGDSTAIWFIQNIGRSFNIIDYYESSGEGLPHYINKLREKGYTYSSHYAPHDIEVREWTGDGKTRLEIARTLGISFKIVPNISIEDGIEAARAILGKCWFDEEKCFRGIQALKSYKKDWDDKNKIFRTHPKHDWSSHGSDAFRYFAVGVDESRPDRLYKESMRVRRRTPSSDGYNLRMA